MCVCAWILQDSNAPCNQFVRFRLQNHLEKMLRTRSADLDATKATLEETQEKV